MNSNTKLKFRLELIWWIATFVILFALFFPILSHVPEYPFLFVNTVYVIIFITFTRYIFLLKHTFLAYLKWLKLVLVFLPIMLLIYLMKELQEFQSYLDEYGFDPFLDHLPFKKRDGLSRYIYTEMLFFGVGSIITAILFPVRMVVSIWRVRNRGGV